jgi:hypothetical protein
MNPMYQSVISEREAREWWDKFRKHSEFNEIWQPNEWGHKEVLPLAREIIKNSIHPPQIKGEQTALILPIIKRDWSLKSVKIQEKTITSGVLWACMSAFAIIDFQQQAIFNVPYSMLKSVEEKYDDFTLGTSVYGPISLTSKPRRLQPAFWFHFAYDFLQVLTSKTTVDYEAIDYRKERESYGDMRRKEKADAFVKDIYEFFRRAGNIRSTQIDNSRLVV